MDRVILHCDCNSFYASVESKLNPEYKTVPMAVCGSTDNRHGIVLAKNELAKKFGIETAETVYEAKKKCPSLVICEPHFDEYIKFSKKVNGIYSKYTDMIEAFGIDESWLDVTASRKLFGSGEEIAELIRKEVRESIGITISVGVSFNKVFAKLGSDYKKPDAVTLISRDKDIVFPLPASSLLYVGKRTNSILLSMGIRTIGELASSSKAILISRLGKVGAMLHKYANGEDESPVSPEREDAKSISSGYTFKHNLTTRDECRVGIEYLASDIGRKLRANCQTCQTIGLTIKDEFLKSIQRQRTANKPTDVGQEIAKVALDILDKEWDINKPIRMLTVSVSNLIKTSNLTTQISFFENQNEIQRQDKSKKREEAVDLIRSKYGNESIFNGSIIDTDIGITKKRK